MHLNDFSNCPITLSNGKVVLCMVGPLVLRLLFQVKIVTRIWPCLFSGTKRRTKQEDHENIIYTVTFMANTTGGASGDGNEQPSAIFSQGAVHICVVCTVAWLACTTS